jgi:alanine dehydrogenase
MTIIGIPKPRMAQERRLALTLDALEPLAHDNTVLIEHNAGLGIDITNELFESLHNNVRVVPTERLYRETDILVSVKEPIIEECELLRSAKQGLHIFSFVHQPALWLTELFQKIGAVVIPFERIVGKNNLRPILAPMSIIAARICLLEGRNHYRNLRGPYLEKSRLVVVGSEGIGGQEAIALALECGFRRENIIGLDLKEKLPPEYLADYTPLPATKNYIAYALAQADIALSMVKAGDAKAPKLITREMIAGMPDHSFFADMSIDEGGASETSRPTTHENPTYEVGGVTHYCVSNMPALWAHTASEELAYAVYPYLAILADAYPLARATTTETSPELEALKNAAMFY